MKNSFSKINVSLKLKYVSLKRFKTIFFNFEGKKRFKIIFLNFEGKKRTILKNQN